MMAWAREVQQAMQAILLDEQQVAELIARRKATGADRYDEVWDGVYVMAPLATNEHQRFAYELARVFSAVAPAGTVVLPGANVSGRRADWQHDYRCPDVVVVLPGSGAADAGTHWVGGPDLIVEVVSPNDRSRDKLAFYASLGVREALLVDRDSKAAELFVSRGGRLEPAAVTGSALLELRTLGVTVATDPSRPALRLVQVATGRSWTV
jgi:Uma2 family endonuclease